MKNKSNIIQFPDRIGDRMSDKFIEEMNDQEDCAELGRFCVDILQKTLRAHEHSPLSDLNFTDTKSEEYKDMFVILNLLVAMFLRKYKISHLLQEDLDDIYDHLEALDLANKAFAHNKETEEEDDIT